jgi:hypothetical protein
MKHDSTVIRSPEELIRALRGSQEYRHLLKPNESCIRDQGSTKYVWLESVSPQRSSLKRIVLVSSLIRIASIEALTEEERRPSTVSLVRESLSKSSSRRDSTLGSEEEFKAVKLSLSLQRDISHGRPSQSRDHAAYTS